MRFSFTTSLFLAILIIPSVSAIAQQGSISGQIFNGDKEAINDAHIRLLGQSVYDVSDHKGAFRLVNISPGEYTLRISRIGYSTLDRKVEIRAGEVTRLTATLQQNRYESPTLVVTATRTRRDIEEVSVPVSVVKQEEVEKTGNTRLSEVLREQTGLNLTSEHGTGLQVQGFDPEYTLIMIDGEPVVGRTAGTLDLSRITVSNIRQIEITKGPSSALWGSDALAGVVNIITEKATEPFEWDIDTQYGTNRSLDAGSSISWKTKGWENNFFINRNSSGGYRLTENSISPTVPEYFNYTASYRTSLPLSNSIEAEFNGRYYREEQESIDFLGSPDNPTLLDNNAFQEDYSLNPRIHLEAGSRLDVTLKYYHSLYRTDQTLTYRSSGETYQNEAFEQLLNKAEVTGNYVWNQKHITTAGSGINREKLRAERYEGNPQFENIFAYAQHEWYLNPRFNITAGFRLDSHSEYDSQLSPKFSARYELREWIHVRASAGRGFKAPDFRQLFLNFTNPTVGYSVFGSGSAVSRIQQLQEEGKISQVLIPLDQFNEITAENSWAYNAGLDFYPLEDLQIRLNAFQNNVDDLIETAPVAQKTNGQSVFSYFNLDRVYTRGFETELRWSRNRNINLSLGYQFLDAQKRISEERTVQDENGNPVQRSFSSYEPMFNRSKHSGTFKLFYTHTGLNLDFNIRGTYRGPYGRLDANGNGYVDNGEYTDGYMLWNTSVAKSFDERFRLQFGVDNIFDFTRPQALSYLPGRIFYTKASITIN